MSLSESQTVGPVRWWGEPLAQDNDEARRRHEANRIAWNEGASYYAAQVEETIDFLRNGGSNLHPIERANLGDLQSWCERAVHLQCASGRDTLSLWNEGVKAVAGVDISDIHIDNARRTAEALGAPARWYRCDVLDAPHELDGWADLVYTGRGSMCWLHDLDAWASVVFRLLKPGGVVHILDDHPMVWLLDFDENRYDFVYTGVSYFDYSECAQGWPDSYIGSLGKPVEQHAKKYERLWPLNEVFAALHGVGLTIECFGEHPESYWDVFPGLKRETLGRVPLTFSMLARRTGD